MSIKILELGRFTSQVRGTTSCLLSGRFPNFLFEGKKVKEFSESLLQNQGDLASLEKKQKNKTKQNKTKAVTALKGG